MDKLKAIEGLAAHALSTLPDSRAESLSLLRMVIFALPPGNDLRVQGQIMAQHLQEAERAQLEFKSLKGRP